MPDFVDIPILYAAAQCGIKIANSGKAEMTVDCPFCSDSKKHLRLNTAKNVYHCHRCNESGNSITLYAKLTGTDNKTAYRELTAGSVIYPTVKHKDIIDRVPLPLVERHAVYSELLHSLNLSAKHRNNLLSRGLDGSVIERNLYRTVPDKAAANRIAKYLSPRFQLTGVPGFYTKDRTWRMVPHQGFFIPVRSIDGKIQGLQIRLDDAQHRKYRWFSSIDKENGTPAQSWIHTANSGGDAILITEGALKADVAAHMTGDCFIGLAGVNSVNGLVPLLNNMGADRVYEAFDLDKHTNMNVVAAAGNIRRTLAEAGIICIPCVWDCNYKGIDDYLLSSEH